MKQTRIWVKWERLFDNRDALVLRPEFDDNGRTRYFNVLARMGASDEALMEIESAVERGFDGCALQPFGMTQYGGVVLKGKVGKEPIEVAEIFGPGQDGADQEVTGS